jgi:hypothetical protein
VTRPHRQAISHDHAAQETNASPSGVAESQRAQRARWHALVRTKRLTPRAMLVAQLFARLPSFPEALPRLRVIAAEVGCSPDQARRCVRELERHALLVRCARRGFFREQRSNLYAALDAATWPWFLGGAEEGRVEAQRVVSSLLRATGSWSHQDAPTIAADWVAALLVQATGCAGLSARVCRARPLAQMPPPPLHGCQPLYPDVHPGHAQKTQHATGPAPSSPATSPPPPAPRAAGSSQAPASAQRPRAPLSELTSRRLWREYPEQAPAILALLARPAHVDDAALCEHAVSRLLGNRTEVGSPVGFVSRVLADELVARAYRPPPEPEPARRVAQAAPEDSLRNHAAALRARLGTCPSSLPAHGPVRPGDPPLIAAHPARVKLQRELDAALATLEQATHQPEETRP